MSKIKGIRKRWMVNSISTVLLIVLLAITAFSAAMASFYYSSMASGLEGKVKYAAGYYNTNYRSELAYQQAARSNVETFDEKNAMELQFINVRGAVDYSSYGLTVSGTYPGTQDIQGALENKVVTPWTGSAPETGERVMAVSAPVLYNGMVVGVMRLVTSLHWVDFQVMVVVAIALTVGLAILLMVYFSNLYFVRSIVEPVGAITDTAKRIAAGSYGIQMGKQYDDEIGDLIDAVNDMSQKINQSEKMKSEFISSVSHELRTPLTAINGWAETLTSGEVRDEVDLRKGMGIIVSEARRLTNMVEELLEFSRIEDGRFTLSMEPLDIKAELEDAVYTYREFFRREGITLTHHDCDEEFPPL
ncbi:MAG: HAMP domain-containing sensor histidine kinase, partial [Oscillospiraceae bacterium]